MAFQPSPDPNEVLAAQHMTQKFVCKNQPGGNCGAAAAETPGNWNRIFAMQGQWRGARSAGLESGGQRTIDQVMTVGSQTPRTFAVHGDGGLGGWRGGHHIVV